MSECSRIFRIQYIFIYFFFVVVVHSFIPTSALSIIFLAFICCKTRGKFGAILFQARLYSMSTFVWVWTVTRTTRSNSQTLVITLRQKFHVIDGLDLRHIMWHKKFILITLCSVLHHDVNVCISCAECIIEWHYNDDTDDQVSKTEVTNEKKKKKIYIKCERWNAGHLMNWKTAIIMAWDLITIGEYFFFPRHSNDK